MSRVSTSTALVSLLALVVQNSATVILLKVSFRPSAVPYATTTLVLVSELTKLVVCSVVVSIRASEDLFAAVESIRSQRLLFLPSALYVLQNNLLLFGAKRLSPLVYLICSQAKVLTTAILSRFVLRIHLSKVQYAALLLLTVGVICVQREALDKDSVSSQETALGVLPGICAVLSATLT